MIALVEGAERAKTPNEIALNIPAGWTLPIFCSLWSRYSIRHLTPRNNLVVVSLLVV